MPPTIDPVKHAKLELQNIESLLQILLEHAAEVAVFTSSEPPQRDMNPSERRRFVRKKANEVIAITVLVSHCLRQLSARLYEAEHQREQAKTQR